MPRCAAASHAGCKVRARRGCGRREHRGAVQCDVMGEPRAGKRGNGMSLALELQNLSKRYRRKWALRDCTVKLPSGHVVALVGPNGAGKTTLLQLAAGLLKPSAGDVRVFGRNSQTYARETLPRVGFVAQDHPLYKNFTVADLLTMGRKMNPRWDQRMAEERLTILDIPLQQRAGKLSGGRQAPVSAGAGTCQASRFNAAG